MKNKLWASEQAKKLGLLKNQTAVKFDMDEIRSKVRHTDGRSPKMRRWWTLYWLPSKHLDPTVWLPKQDSGAVALGWGLCCNDWDCQFGTRVLYPEAR